MRLIDADALKDHIELQRVSYARIGAIERAEAFANCLWVIAQAPTIGGWISVKDRLPDEQETYLVYRKEPFGAVTIAWYSGPENGWLALEGCFYADGVVTHWRLMPEPPKGDD